MKEFPLVSIIIPCYNDEKYIVKSINSALAQTYENKEIIVIDDGSNEITKTLLRELKSQVEKLITQDNKGAGAARNIGIQNCSGEFILNHDSDDLFDPTFCEKAVAHFQSSNSIKIVTCHTERFNSKGVIDELILKSSSLKDFLRFNCAMGSSMFKKKDWLEAGKYDESRLLNGYEDWEFFIRILKHGGISYVIPEKLFFYRVKEYSNSSQANKRKYEILKYIYSKHKDLYIVHYNVLIDHFLNRLEILENAERKNKDKIEFRIGERLLGPVRKIKKIFETNFNK
jgi:glycosyltransferase involved in cell wall biosynthesis